MVDQTLLQPFLAKLKPTTKGSALESDSGILLRLLSVTLIGAISLWANYEASKGFSLTIINEAKDSRPGKRFSLFFESDDTAVRVLLDTSFFVERFLYESVPHRLRKPVNHVTIRFSDGVEKFLVTSNASHGGYVIRLSSSLMERSDFTNAVKSAFRRSMVRIFLWGDESGASPELVTGMVEYLAVWLEPGRKVDRFDEDKESVVRWLDYCERRSEGFIRRLNHGSNGACDSRKVMLRELKDQRQWV